MTQTNTKGLARHIPNALTVGRLALTLVFLLMVLYAPRLGEAKPWPFLTAAFVLFVIAGLTDVVDGTIARALGVTSKFGRLLDPLVDKVLVCGAFICFALVGQPRFANFLVAPYELPEWLFDVFRWLTAVILAVREVGVTILRHVAEARGVAFGAVVSGKIKMFLQSFAIGTVVIGWAFVSRTWGDWFTVVTFVLMLAITVASGIQSLCRPIRPPAPAA